MVGPRWRRLLLHLISLTSSHSLPIPKHTYPSSTFSPSLLVHYDLCSCPLSTHQSEKTALLLFFLAWVVAKFSIFNHLFSFVQFCTISAAAMEVEQAALSSIWPAPQIAATTAVAESGRSSSSHAAVKLQKVYRSYRTRRWLADSAVVAEELWWLAIDHVRLNHNTISFFNHLQPESPHSRWNRVTHNASRVGKGLSKDEKAKELAFQHWIEAIDPRHRYGHNLHFYYEEWCKGVAGQPFFHWLDLGDGKNVDLKECPRSVMRQQCIRYLGPQEREHFEYIVKDGKVVHKQSGDFLDTKMGCEEEIWIFVMSTSKRLYAGQKKKGAFHHSSFLAGAATLAAGRLISESGRLEAIWASSGHYKPTEENLRSFVNFLEDSGVNLQEVKILSPSYEETLSQETVVQATPLVKDQEEPSEQVETPPLKVSSIYRTLSGGLQSPRANISPKAVLERIDSKKATKSYQLGHQLSRKWSTGAGPRIGCVADYPPEVRFQALEFGMLSPRFPPTPHHIS